jgi:hypothetical protein
MPPDRDSGKEKIRRKEVVFEIARSNLYSGPNSEGLPINPESILELIILPQEEQKYPGWIVTRTKDKNGTGVGFLIVPQESQSKIFDEINFMQEIIDGKGSLPTTSKFFHKIQNCILWIGNPINPELTYFKR